VGLQRFTEISLIRDRIHSVIFWLRLLFVVLHNNKLCNICFEDVTVENIFQYGYWKTLL